MSATRLDSKLASGRRFPMAPSETLHGRTSVLWLWALCCLLMPSGLFAAGKGMTLESYLQKLGYGVIPLERTKENQLFVRAELDGRACPLLVDTGWSLTALDSALAGKFKSAKDMGVKVRDQESGITHFGDTAVVQKLKLGQVQFWNQPFERMSLKAQGSGVSGVLGCDFLIRSHAIVDCGAKRLYVRGESLAAELKAALEKSLKSSGYVAADVKRSSDLAQVCSATLNGQPVKLLVDTGGIWTMLDDEKARKLKLVLSKTGRAIGGVKAGMVSELLTAQVKSLRSGGAEFPIRGLLIGVGELQPWIPERSNEAPDGILGAEMLAVSGALIDFGADQMWFVPAAS